LLADFATAVNGKAIAHSWRSTAARVYSNWLEYLCEQKERRLSRVAVASHAHA